MKQVQPGIYMLGEQGVYLRSVSLALATAIFTDTLSVNHGNEDMRTQKAIER